MSTCNTAIPFALTIISELWFDGASGPMLEANTAQVLAAARVTDWMVELDLAAAAAKP